MSKYTTGEIANLCGISVRTVQYYDTRGLLIPSELSEGGRRIYSEDDLRRMKIICFLRELDLSIDSIKLLFREDHPEHVIALLLDEQQARLDAEIASLQGKAAKVGDLRQTLKKVSHFSVDSIADIAHIMQHKKDLRKLRLALLLIGFLMDAIEIGTLILWIFTGIWWPFALGMPFVLGLGIGASCLYFRQVAYICPECHTIFKPAFRESFSARHTPNTRRLHCPACAHFGFCIETYGKDRASHDPT